MRKGTLFEVIVCGLLLVGCRWFFVLHALCLLVLPERFGFGFTRSLVSAF